MNSFGMVQQAILLAGLLLAAEVHRVRAQSSTNSLATNEIRILELQGTVEISPAGATAWILTQSNQVVHALDRLRTGPNSRVVLRWSDQSLVPFGALTELEILPPDSPRSESGLHLVKGILSFFHRDKPGRIRVITRGAVAGIEGTEFVMAVDEISNSERTTLWVVDGRVRFGNEQAELVLTNGQLAVAEPGKAPMLTAGFIANNILQWCFYYPAVLELGDLPLSPAEQADLADSLRAYRAGDLLAALARYPSGRRRGSEAESVYYAALLLAVGQVEQTEKELTRLQATNPDERILRLADALRTLIAAVKLQPHPSTREPQLSSELLAASYYEQSKATREISLARALDLAKRAATIAPQSGFAWERVAELEFSFGRVGRALENLNKSLALSPRNAEALALKGFLLASENRTKEAIVWFNEALEVDSALGNAWLGRGLCRIRRGDTSGGREDLLVAAALEPQRALLRSYLGKAYANEGDFKRAEKELKLAEKLDPNDPTSWLYSALLKQQENLINEAIRDLEKSEELNDNRSVYRSGLLVDQDRAVRSANLAAIYRDAGMFDVSLREASRAVTYDYGNYSAHLFLANSYVELSDPNRINLRYETPAESEFLLANLLAPAGAGTLSPAVSQQEYTRLFEHDRLGFYSSTEYLSRGAWTQDAVQYGTFGTFSYDIEAFYHSDGGQRINNDTEQRRFFLEAKQQITSQDSVYLQASDFHAESGDLVERFDPRNADATFRSKENQEPILLTGYHHEWSPGVHTLLLAARLDDTFSFTNVRPTAAVYRTGANIDGVQGITMADKFRGNLEIYSIEAQQILQGPRANTIFGIRGQWGRFRATSVQSNPSDLQAFFPDPPVPASSQDLVTDFRRITAYVYHSHELLTALWLIGGVSYDRITFPENLDDAPISPNTSTKDQVAPKAGLVWTPTENSVLRFAYTKALSGASLDQSYQLEPSQVAGFIQSFRSIIPESVAGGNSGARFETFGLSLEQKFKASTYLGISGEILNSEVQRTRGAFDIFPELAQFGIPSGLRENLDYTEKALLITLNQLLGSEVALGGRYRLSDVHFTDAFQLPSATPVIDFRPSQQLESLLHQLNLYVLYNHPSGLFGRFDALWYAQDNKGLMRGEPGDRFWQFDFTAGFRFVHRRAQIELGGLNLTGQDYRLSPLNLYNELPRHRTFVARLQFNF
jgi:tetratricopeptide (TPR) repeat protein